MATTSDTVALEMLETRTVLESSDDDDRLVAGDGFGALSGEDHDVGEVRVGEKPIADGEFKG